MVLLASSVMCVYELIWGMQVLDDLDAVLDVGGVYDPSNDRYDHHQKGFEEVFGHGFSTKLSSAGLVYKVVICSITWYLACSNWAGTSSGIKLGFLWQFICLLGW